MQRETDSIVTRESPARSTSRQARHLGSCAALALLWLASACLGPQARPPSSPEPARLSSLEPSSGGPAQGQSATLGPSTKAPVEETLTAPRRPATTPRPASLDTLTIELVAVAEGFEQPLFVTHSDASSHRLYVVEKAGRVLSFLPGAAETSRRVEIDLSQRVESGGFEQGLLGLAFHPGFRQNGRLFVDYIDLEGEGRVSELRRQPDRSGFDASSERLLLRIPQPASNHNGGHLAFGPDGRLYVGSGDGGGADDRYEQGQNPEGLAGKILALDVDAPLATPGPPDIVARGLRNPWRFSFDRANGDLYLGDVGQASAEEIDHLPADAIGRDANFGWPVFEGQDCFGEAEDCQGAAAAAMLPPILAYPHQDGDCSVTGGYVHRGSDPEDAIHGAYLFADYCSGRIFAARRDPQGRWRWRVLLDSDLAIASFGQDAAGALYVCDLSGGGIYRIEPRSGDEPQQQESAGPRASSRPGL